MTVAGLAEIVARSTRRAPLSRGAVCVVNAGATGDGVAQAGRLAYDAVAHITGRDPVLVDLAAPFPAPVSHAARARFYARLVAAQTVAGADWLVFNHIGIAVAQLRVPRPWRRPYALMAHGIEVWDPRLEESRKEVMRRAALVIASSRHTESRLAEAYPELTRLVPCPLALVPDEPIAISDPGPIAPLSVVIVGRMSAAERYKGHDELIAAWPSVLAQHPEARLVCIGRGDDVERLRSDAAAAGVGHAVRFPGFLSEADLEGVLRRAAVFAMPSRGEGFGFVYLQAMRAGLPCVGCERDAAADIIMHGETGFLVPPRDVPALAASIVQLLASPSLRQRLGAAGLRRLRAEYTLAAYVERLRPLLERLNGVGRERPR